QLRAILRRAAAGENVQQEFQNTVRLAEQNSQRLVSLYAVEPSVWKTRGAFYEVITPVIAGAGRFAIDSYTKATDLDPQNPTAWLDLGRVYLIIADQAQIAAGQSKQDQQSLLQIRASALGEAEKALNKAIQVKSDFPEAHFLLAQ